MSPFYKLLLLLRCFQGMIPNNKKIIMYMGEKRNKVSRLTKSFWNLTRQSEVSPNWIGELN